MALNPYSRENSTYMPVGEPKRQDEVASQYRSEAFENEVEGIVYAMLMQYAKIDSENADKRARQFAKILYEYSARLINDLDVGNSVIAQKIANAIDNKIATELNDLAKDIDFQSDTINVRKTVSDYLTSLVSVANGSLVTASQIGLSGGTATAAAATSYSGAVVAAQTTEAAEESINSELSQSFIELIKSENRIAPDSRNMPVRPRELTIPVQQLAVSAASIFNESVITFTSGLTTKTVERLANIQKAVSNFGQMSAANAKNAAGGSGGGGVANDSHSTIRQAIQVKRGTMSNHLMLVHSEAQAMEEDQSEEEKTLRGWVTTLDSMKQQFDDMQRVVGSVISGTIRFAASAFNTLAENIRHTYKRVKNGTFLDFLMSPAGILSFGLLGWAGYKLIFGGVGEKIKESIAGIINSAVSAAIPIVDVFFGTSGGSKKPEDMAQLTEAQKKGLEAVEDEKLKKNVFSFLDLQEKMKSSAEKWLGFKEERNFEDKLPEPVDENDGGNFFSRLFGFGAEEAEFYMSLDVSKNGVGNTMDDVTDHWLVNIEKMDSVVGQMTKEKWGMTPQEWLLSLNTDHTAGVGTKAGTGSGWLDSIKMGMKNFWSHIKTTVDGGVEWFKQTEIGKSVVSTWDIISSTAIEIYKSYEPIIKVAIKLAPLMAAISLILQPPVGTILSMIGRLGNLMISLARLSFMKPVLGAIGSMLKENPLAGLMIAGIAIGLGVLARGIWNAFHKKPMDNGGIMPLEQYAISMGLAKGQKDKYGVESRLGQWTGVLMHNDGSEKALAMKKRLEELGLDAKALTTVTSGLAQFEENYRLTMDNQDADSAGTLHWFILNRRASIEKSMWARRMAELPMLGIGPELVHEQMYNEFVRQLDKKFPGKDEKTWNSVRAMMMRMKDVDLTFRRVFDMANAEDVANFVKSVNTDRDKVRAIYEWTHNGGQFDLQKHIGDMFGARLKKRLESIPDISIEIRPTPGLWVRHDPTLDMIIKVGDRSNVMTFPSVKTDNIDRLHIFKTLFTGLAGNVEEVNNLVGEDRNARMDTFIKVSSINPYAAALAFMNYMNRPKSGFNTLYPWRLSEDEAKNLKIMNDDGERTFKMKDLVSEVDRYKNASMNKIRSGSAMETIENKYKDLPNFDNQNDSKALVGMVYVLGAILQLCDEIDK